jgi:hypothetical protein
MGLAFNVALNRTVYLIRKLNCGKFWCDDTIFNPPKCLIQPPNYLRRVSQKEALEYFSVKPKPGWTPEGVGG